jgi:hypothetical protein
VLRPIVFESENRYSLCASKILFVCFTNLSRNHGALDVLDRLDRLVRLIAVPNLTMFIIVGQLLMFFAAFGDDTLLERSLLVWDKVLEGEVWRLLTFFFVPPTTDVIFLIFAYLIFYMMGNALEAYWGVVRYNSFLWLGAIMTIAAAGICHDQGVSGKFLQGTVFLAFATINPDFELRLFFVLPVKVKWLAMIQGIGYGVALIIGPWSTKVVVLASFGNYLIFFAPELFSRVRSTHRRVQWDKRQSQADATPRHTCRTCGVNSLGDPNMDFRYCSQCAGEHAYCEAHLRDHQHVVEEAAGKSSPD